MIDSLVKENTQYADLIDPGAAPLKTRHRLLRIGAIERELVPLPGMDSAKDIKKIKVDAYTGAKKTEEKEEDKAPLRASLEDWGWHVWA